MTISMATDGGNMTISIYIVKAYPRNLNHCPLGEDNPSLLFGDFKQRKVGYQCCTVYSLKR